MALPAEDDTACLGGCVDACIAAGAGTGAGADVSGSDKTRTAETDMLAADSSAASDTAVVSAADSVTVSADDAGSDAAAVAGSLMVITGTSTDAAVIVARVAEELPTDVGEIPVPDISLAIKSISPSSSKPEVEGASIRVDVAAASVATMVSGWALNESLAKGDDKDCELLTSFAAG